jgi:hypothetical protein
MRYRCPVCMFPSLPYPPSDYHICPCCSTEFGNDDADLSHHQLREMWIASGANWFFGNAPEHWNPWIQLISAGLALYVPSQFRMPFVGFLLSVDNAPVEALTISIRAGQYGSLALVA